MEITVTTRYKIAELTIESGNTKINESMTIVDKSGKFIVPQADIEQLITAANELSRFNNTSDVAFCMSILDAFLNESEKLELIDRLSL